MKDYSNKYSPEYYKSKTIEWLDQLSTSAEESSNLDRLDTAMDYNSCIRLTVLSIKNLLRKGKIRDVYKFIDDIVDMVDYNYSSLEACYDSVLDDMEIQDEFIGDSKFKEFNNVRDFKWTDL